MYPTVTERIAADHRRGTAMRRSGSADAADDGRPRRPASPTSGWRRTTRTGADASVPTAWRRCSRRRRRAAAGAYAIAGMNGPPRPTCRSPSVGTCKRPRPRARRRARRLREAGDDVLARVEAPIRRSLPARRSDGGRLPARPGRAPGQRWNMDEGVHLGHRQTRGAGELVARHVSSLDGLGGTVDDADAGAAHADAGPTGVSGPCRRGS